MGFGISGSMDDLNSEPTLPPIRAIRFDTLDRLFDELPELNDFITDRPDSGEGYRAFLQRLRASATPEDAITFTAFALTPKAGVKWALDCILRLQPEQPWSDTQLMNWITAWLEDPQPDARWKTLELSLFTTPRSPMVQVGLAVGWSGGPLAPNDFVEMPAWRTPRVLSSAVLKALGQLPTDQRDAGTDYILDKAVGLFRIH
jgi:hypothetical protein